MEKKKQLGAKSGSRADVAPLATKGVWQTLNFRNEQGESSQSFTFTDPGGGGYWIAVLGKHRVRYTDNPIREFMIDWIVHPGDQFTVTVSAEAYSTNEDPSVTWDADIEIGVLFF